MRTPSPAVIPPMHDLITPCAHARARGYVIGRGVYIIYIIIYSMRTPSPAVIPPMHDLITPCAHARARGYVIGRGVYIIYIIIYKKSGLFFGTNLLSPKILTLRGLF